LRIMSCFTLSTCSIKVRVLEIGDRAEGESCDLKRMCNATCWSKLPFT
jgi:hypothetical protein